jgi:hypothetical protein
MEKIFSEEDLDYIVSRGNSLDKIMQQLHYFKNGISKISLVKSARVGDGIWKFDESQKNEFISYFEKHASKYVIEKFVPASGAATRMFQFLNEFLNRFNPETDTITSYVNKYQENQLSVFIVGIRNFPFHSVLKEKTKQNFKEYPSFTSDKKVHAIISTLLSEKGLNYAAFPKGILPFHLVDNVVQTPIDEHCLEALHFINTNGKAKLHFTISKEFQKDFEKIVAKYPEVEIGFSYQDQTSDTIAVDDDNLPFRLENGQLFFRPGGHGALIENLNKLNSDIVFIKNIDNVSNNAQDLVLENKKLLGGVLFYTQYQIFSYIKILRKEEHLSDELLKEIIDFIETKLCFPLIEEFHMFQIAYQKEYLLRILNRPIRVCGMVKNEGEPGGGPFWVKDYKGRWSLQIVESSQIDMQNEEQKEIFSSASHFNPVDIICALKDYEGNKFNLSQFIDPEAAFITQKTKLGKSIKAFELPGLWNGAMAKWTTIFIEIPLETFNPVKTVNDLLKPAHQENNE